MGRSCCLTMRDHADAIIPTMRAQLVKNRDLATSGLRWDSRSLVSVILCALSSVS